MSDLLSLKPMAALMVLSSAVIHDLQSKKIPNRLVLMTLATSFLLCLYLDGPAGLVGAIASLVAAFVLGLPVYLLKVFAGGDFKFYVALAPMMDWKIAIAMLGLSLIWGSILGAFVVLFKGQAGTFFRNIFLLVSIRQKTDPLLTHKIPYSIALLLGFLTAKTLPQDILSWWGL